MATNSRYDFMTSGATLDEVSNSAYPDPLSLDYSKIKLSEVPTKDTLSSDSIIFFWREMEGYYQQPCWDDMVLTLNGIPHKNFLKPGDKVYLPLKNDIINSFSKGR